MANIAELIEAVSEQLDRANDANDARTAEGHVLIACATLLEIIKRQEQRNQQVASALDELATRINYPITSIRETRAQVRQVARVLRGDHSENDERQA